MKSQLSLRRLSDHIKKKKLKDEEYIVGYIQYFVHYEADEGRVVERHNSRALEIIDYLIEKNKYEDEIVSNCLRSSEEVFERFAS